MKRCALSERPGPLQPGTCGQSRPVGVEHAGAKPAAVGCRGWHCLGPCLVILNDSATEGKGCLHDFPEPGEQVTGGRPAGPLWSQ